MATDIYVYIHTIYLFSLNVKGLWGPEGHAQKACGGHGVSKGRGGLGQISSLGLKGLGVPGLESLGARV